MTREMILSRISALQMQKSQAEQMFEQMKANINAIHGAIQFAEDLLKSMPEVDAAPVVDNAPTLFQPEGE